jgi:hypothetical protein
MRDSVNNKQLKVVFFLKHFSTRYCEIFWYTIKSKCTIDHTIIYSYYQDIVTMVIWNNKPC